MAQTDNAIRALMGTAYQRVAQWLAPNATGTTPTELLDPVLPGEEAIPDAIIRLPNQQLLHIEFQGYKDPNMAARMHRYNQRIADRYTLHPTQYLIGVHPDAGTLPTQYRYNGGHAYWNTINLWDIPATDIIHTVPEFAVLANHDGNPQHILNTIRDWIETTFDRKKRPEIVEIIQLLATTKYPQQDLDSWARRITMANSGIIERSSWAQDLIQHARQEGTEQGQAEGRRAGQIQLVTTLLDRRFDNAWQPEHDRVEQLPTELFDDLAVALLDWHHPTELTTWLNHNT